MTTEFHAGDFVGAYRLEARVGGGGFGTVWRARELSSGRVVALKLLPETDDDNETARLAAELEVLAASAAGKSPHVVQVLDGGIDPVPYVVMEFVTGSSLEEVLRQRRRLSQAEVIDIGMAVADALAGLDAAGIVHRDLKPSNIMIDRAGTVRLTDFGIAKIAGLDARTVTGQLPLSINYAAPEVWEGRAEHRSDLYALGVVLFQCLSGGPPFRGGYAELFYHHRSTEPDLTRLPPETVPALAALVGRCLRKQPDDRPSSAAACAVALREAKEQLAVVSNVPPPLTREPERFGLWVKGEPHPSEPWSWFCTHETSGRRAVVTVYFTDSLEQGEALRRAVAASAHLAPLGAEHLAGTNRLILRPGEAWTDPPPGNFQFWLAKDETPPLAAPPIVTAPILLRTCESLMALLDAAEGEGVPLSLAPPLVSLRADGTVYVRDAGIVEPGAEGAEAEAIAFIRQLPLTADVRQIVERSTHLDDIRKATAILVEVRQVAAAKAPPVPPRRARAAAPVPAHRRSLPPILPKLGLAAGFFIAIATVVAAGFMILPDGDDPSQAVIEPPTPTATPASPEVAMCLDLDLPAPLAEAAAACSPAGATFREDANCPRAAACNRIVSDTGAITISQNSRTVALIDDAGNLVISPAGARGDYRLSSSGVASDPAWSPDGRYIAYVETRPLPLQQTLPGQPAPSQRYVTQLRVVEADRPANDGIVIATNTGENEAEWRRLSIVSPAWSLDGHSLYFVWMTPDGRGTGLYAVELARRSGSQELDFSVLRSAAPPTEAIIPNRVSRLDIEAADFGVSTGYIGRFIVATDGAIYARVCEGPSDRTRCGLGRWDGTATLLRPIEDGVSYAPPAVTADALLVPVWQASTGWRLQRYGMDGSPIQGPAIALVAPETVLASPVPHIAALREGEQALIEAQGGELKIVSLADGTTTAFGKGRAPVSFKEREPQPSTPAPGATAFATPTGTPTPSPTPTVTPTPTRDYRPMTIAISARRGNSPAAGVDVVALVDNQECASGRTGPDGQVTIVMPRQTAPSACSDPGASIRYRVDGTMIPTSTTFNPQGQTSFQVVLP